MVNKKQWFGLQMMFLIFMCILIFMDFGNSSLTYTSFDNSNISAFEVHLAVEDALRDMSITICFFLSNVFMILGWLEK